MSAAQIAKPTLRILFGSLFLWSGIAKIKQPLAFADAVRNFDLVGDPLAPALAILIPCLEITAGLFALLGLFWRGAVAILTASLLLFSAALVVAWGRGLDVSCGCFGGGGAINYPLALGRNALLIATGLFLLFCSRNFPASPQGSNPP